MMIHLRCKETILEEGIMSEHTQHMYAAALFALDVNTGEAKVAAVLFKSANDTDAHQYAIARVYEEYPTIKGYSYHSVDIVQAPDHMVNLD
jgi:hypothetical protein